MYVLQNGWHDGCMDGNITVRDVTKVQARSANGWSWGDGDVHTYSLVQGALFTTCSI